MADNGDITEVFIDENGNAWAGDRLIVIEGEKGTLITPPAGITKGAAAPMVNGTYQFSAGSDGQPVGEGTFKGAGGDVSKIASIISGIKNIDWGKLKSIGNFFKDNASTIIAGAALVSSYRSEDRQNEILERQLGASDRMFDAWEQDRQESKPLRDNLYSALQNRMGQGAPPALMPGKVAYANPYQNVVKIGRGESGSGSPESGPGATLRDAIRSQFTDRHPNAPAQHFVQQHPDRNARPGGPSTWEGQGQGAAASPAGKAVAGPLQDQRGRRGTESADPYNTRVQGSGEQGSSGQAGGVGGQSGRGVGRDRWNTHPPNPTPRDDAPYFPVDQSGRAATEGAAPRGGSYFDTSVAPEIVPSGTDTGLSPEQEGLLAIALRELGRDDYASDANARWRARGATDVDSWFQGADRHNRGM